MSLLDRIDLAWAAGLFEGEGSISLWERKERPGLKVARVQLQMTDEDVVRRFSRIMQLPEPKVYAPSSRGKRWVWHVSVAKREEVVRVLSALLPYLGDRRRGKALDILYYFETYPFRFRGDRA